MSDKFGDVHIATQVRDTIRKIAQREIQRAVPNDRYGTVVGIDLVNMRAEIQFNGDDPLVDPPNWIAYGKMMEPTATGQMVRVSGLAQDRYVSELLSGDTAWAAIRGLPIGGTTGQVLTKIDATDFNADWETPGAGGGFPLVVTDGTRTYSITAPTGLHPTTGQDLVLEVYQNSDPPDHSHIAVGWSFIDFDATSGSADINVRAGNDWNQRTGNDFNLNVGHDFNVSLAEDFNVNAARDINMSGGRDVGLTASTGHGVTLGTFVRMQALADSPYRPPTPDSGFVHLWIRYNAGVAEFSIMYDDGTTHIIDSH